MKAKRVEVFVSELTNPYGYRTVLFLFHSHLPRRSIRVRRSSENKSILDLALESTTTFENKPVRYSKVDSPISHKVTEELKNFICIGNYNCKV